MVTRIGPSKPVQLFIAEWRAERALTQQQLADRIGTTKSSISRWESRGRDLTLNVLAAIAQALQVDEEDLYRDPKRPSIDALIRGAPADLQQRAAEIVRVLIKQAG